MMAQPAALDAARLRAAVLHRLVSRAPALRGQKGPLWLKNRDRGEPHGSAPPTPPDIRVRIRRFGGLSAGDLSRQRRRLRQWSPSLRLRSLRAAPSGLHPFPSLQRPETWIFCRMAGARAPHPSVLPTFRPSAKLVPPTMPSADFSAAITDVAARSVRNPGHVGDL